VKILIYGINYAPELTGIGKYTGEMAAYLAAQGNTVEVITTPPYYPQWRVREEYRGGWRKEQLEGVTVLRCPLYVPAEVNGLKRILHELTFVVSSLRYWIPRYFRRYDLIICISPPFHLGFLALPHRWLQKTPVLNHIQDLQVDAARDLKIIKNEKLLRLLERTERWLLRRFDVVSTISTGMQRKVVAKGLAADQVWLFPNWVDASVIYPIPKEQSLRTTWGYAPEDRLVLYAGNLGDKQGLDNVLYMAKRMEQEPNLQFLIVGEGKDKGRLVSLAQELGLTNLQFKPLQPLDLLAASLASADVHLILQKRAAADLVMPSKLTNILAVGGHALITAEPGSTLYDVVDSNRLGTLVEPESVDALVEGLQNILNGNCEADHSGAHHFAETQLNKQNILGDFHYSLSQLEHILIIIFKCNLHDQNC